MLFKSIAAIAALTTAFAAPVENTHPLLERQMSSNAPSDTQILQYALTLENLEATFYAQALQKFSAQDFANAGFPSWVRGRVSQIAQHEASHVKLLSAALGNNSVAACTYSFPYTDPKSFITLAWGIENIGVSAYAGANQYISNAQYRSVAAVILSVEARHNGFFGGPVSLAYDWTGPYDTPLGLNMVYTLAAQLITSCPSSNAMLPVMSYGALTSGGSPIFAGAAGSTVTLSYKGAGSGQMAVVYNGLGSTMVSINNNQITLPQGIQGFSYVLITNATSASAVSSSNIVAGPAEIITPFDASQSNPGFMNPYGA